MYFCIISFIVYIDFFAYVCYNEQMIGVWDYFMRRKPLLLLLIVGFTMSGMVSGFLMSYLKTDSSSPAPEVNIVSGESAGTAPELKKPEMVAVPIVVDRPQGESQPYQDAPGGNHPDTVRIEITQDATVQGNEIPPVPTDQQIASVDSGSVEVPLTGGATPNFFADAFSMIAHPQQVNISQQDQEVAIWRKIVFETTLALSAGAILILGTNIVYKMHRGKLQHSPKSSSKVADGMIE